MQSLISFLISDQNQYTVVIAKGDDLNVAWYTLQLNNLSSHFRKSNIAHILSYLQGQEVMFSSRIS